MGFTNALNACFTMHQLNHSHWATITNGQKWVAQPEHGVADWRSAPPVQQATKFDPGIVPVAGE
jgi:enoyl-CoA hydratase